MYPDILMTCFDVADGISRPEQIYYIKIWDDILFCGCMHLFFLTCNVLDSMIMKYHIKADSLVSWVG